MWSEPQNTNKIGTAKYLLLMNQNKLHTIHIGNPSPDNQNLQWGECEVSLKSKQN